MLQFMRSQRVGHNLATEQRQSKEAHSLGFLKRSIVSFLKVTTDSSTLVSLEMQIPMEAYSED